MDLSVPKPTLYSAAEIAAMRLPGLPTTKARVLERAAAEGWTFEERTGLGGKRRMFAIPKRYAPALHGEDQESTKTGELLQKASELVAEGRRSGELDDGQLIQEVVLGVEMWLSKNGLQPDPKRKAALIALLFRYFKDEGTIDETKLDNLLRAVA